MPCFGVEICRYCSLPLPLPLQAHAYADLGMSFGQVLLKKVKGDVARHLSEKASTSLCPASLVVPALIRPSHSRGLQ